MTLNYFYKENHVQSSSKKYLQSVRSHLDAIGAIRDTLAKERQLLADKVRLRPVECYDIESMLTQLLNTTRNFEEFLKDGSKLPDSAAPKRYKVYVSLNYIEQNIIEALPMLSAFRSICLESSPKTWEMLAEIWQSIDSLLRISEMLELETKEMLSKILSESLFESSGLISYVNYEN